jgi:hypothetical protein
VSEEEAGRGQVTRRALLRGAATSTVIGAAWSQLPAQESLAATSRTWLGRDYWPNRLQDWAGRNGRIECVAKPGNRLVRTVAVLTRSIAGAPAEIRIRTGTLQAGRGYSGFLIGTGTPESHPLAAALVFTASGTGGGVFAAYDADGQVRFATTPTSSTRSAMRSCRSPYAARHRRGGSARTSTSYWRSWPTVPAGFDCACAPSIGGPDDSCPRRSCQASSGRGCKAGSASCRPTGPTQVLATGSEPSRPPAPVWRSIRSGRSVRWPGRCSVGLNRSCG